MMEKVTIPRQLSTDVGMKEVEIKSLKVCRYCLVGFCCKVRASSPVGVCVPYMLNVIIGCFQQQLEVSEEKSEKRLRDWKRCLKDKEAVQADISEFKAEVGKPHVVELQLLSSEFTFFYAFKISSY